MPTFQNNPDVVSIAQQMPIRHHIWVQRKTMGILNNSRHELFAQGIAKGLTADAAYQEAGYKPNRHNASALKTKKHISERVAELVEAAAEKSTKSLSDVLREYERIAFTGMSRFVHVDEDGVPRIDLSGCTPADLDLLSEITTEAHQMPGDAPGQILKVKIKPLERLRALEKLAAHLGMGDKEANKSTDRLADAIHALSQRGSAVPVATQRAAKPPAKRGWK